MARDSRYTEATKLAQNDMQKVIDSFGEDTPFMSDGVSARTEARRAKLANAPADIRALLDRGFPRYFVEQLFEDEVYQRDTGERSRDKRLGLGSAWQFGQGAPLMPTEPDADAIENAAIERQYEQDRLAAIAAYENRHVGSKRPSSEVLGVTPEIGGMPQPENATFMSSDVLSRAALAGLPSTFAQFANRKIEREPQTGYGGYYQPGNGRVVVDRQVEQSSRDYAVNTARHELTHALQYEHPVYRADEDAGFPRLQDALGASWPALNANPLYGSLVEKLTQSMNDDDYPHVFTQLAELAVKGYPLPAPLGAYLKDLVGDKPQPSPPPPRRR